jgi:hypothetical protein
MMNKSVTITTHYTRSRPLCQQRLPKVAESLAAQVVGLYQGAANLVHLPNVPEGRCVDSPAVYAVILALGHCQVL